MNKYICHGYFCYLFIHSLLSNAAFHLTLMISGNFKSEAEMIFICFIHFSGVPGAPHTVLMAVD